jgi:hypothetical protein
MYKKYILNGSDNILYDAYSLIKSTKILWEALDRKYKAKDVGMQRFIVGKFMDFKMVNSRTVINQVKKF